MQILNSILTWVMKERIHQMELFMKYPHEVREVLRKPIETGSGRDSGPVQLYV